MEFSEGRAFSWVGVVVRFGGHKAGWKPVQEATSAEVSYERRRSVPGQPPLSQGRHHSHAPTLGGQRPPATSRRRSDTVPRLKSNAGRVETSELRTPGDRGN